MTHLINLSQIIDNFLIPSRFVKMFVKLSMVIFCLSIFACGESVPELTLEEMIQNRLDNGETALEVYNNLGLNRADDLVGYDYQGGIIIQFDAGSGNGFIVSREDIGFFPFGCYGTIIDGLPSFFGGSGIGDGLINTEKILAYDCSLDSAAKACADYESDGYEDWFLPSLGELRLVEITRASGEFWSSTAYSVAGEQDPNRAWVQVLDNDVLCGQSGLFGEAVSNCRFSRERKRDKRVRAVRQF